MTSSLDSRGGAFITDPSPLAIGTHVLSASYSGDSSFLPSASAPVTLTVTKGATQIFLLVLAGALPNTPVTLEAVVFPALGQASPTGTAQFFVGGVTLGNPVQLQSFVALLTTSQLQNGPSSITATYSGDSNFNGSNSTTSTIIVGNPDFQIGVNPGALTVATGRARERYFAVEPGLGTGLRRQCHDELFGAAGGRGVQFSAATSGP